MDALLGFGLAGSLLAHALPDRPWLVVDPVAPARDGRSFGTWARGPHPMDAVARGVWRHLAVVTPAGRSVLALAPYRYLAFRMGDWRQHVAARLTRATFRAEAAHAVHDTPYGATIALDDGEVPVRWVFDARGAPNVLPPGSPRSVALWQSFQGARIAVDADTFDPELPVWMDFRGETPTGCVSFGYVMPEGPRAALVERVVIGPAPVAAGLDAYLRGPLGIASWRVSASEGGATPMTDRVFPRRLGPRTLALGIRGGRLQPSTGYGIGRMARDAGHVARSLAAHGHPFELPADPAAFRLLDTLLLRVLRDEPQRAPAVFEAMLTKNTGGALLAFLDGAAGPARVAALGCTLPLAPFLRALGR